MRKPDLISMNGPLRMNISVHLTKGFNWPKESRQKLFSRLVLTPRGDVLARNFFGQDDLSWKNFLQKEKTHLYDRLLYKIE